MTDDNIKHFEQLWEEAEQLSVKVFETKDKDVIQLITDLLEDYRNLIDSELPQEVVVSLRKRYIGEIVFWITLISAKHNIDVYGALMEEIKLNQ